MLLQLLLAAIVSALPPVRASEDAGDSNVPRFSAEAAAIFNKRCTACHTYGKGIKVGPDLKGVTERRKRDWLFRFIHASSTVIQSGDPTATALFTQFKQQRMPDWTDLSDRQIGDILNFLAVGGPDIKPLDERNAETATSRDVEMGQKLFLGDEHFKYGAPPCVQCHSTQTIGFRGGNLGPDLTKTYWRYQDAALTLFLRHPCFAWENQASSSEQYLTARESFDIKAFLRHSSQ